MKTLEKCVWKVSVEINSKLAIPKGIINNRNCVKDCDGYNNNCGEYTIIKEECYGL